MNQLQTRPPQEEPESSLWRRYRASKKARQITSALLFGLPIVVLITLMYTVFIRPPFDPKAGLHISPPIGVRTNDLDVLSAEVLQDMNAHSWDGQHQTTLINWRKSDPAQVNCGPEHCDQRGHSTRQDSANDLRLLENMYWYRARHPGDTSLDTFIARILPTVQRGWGHTILNKGWVYFELLRMRDYSGAIAYWNQTLQGWATSEYQHLDHTLGIQHGRIDTSAGAVKAPLQDGYRVDHALETGLALVDAGTRFQHPEWITAGKRDVAEVIKQAYNPQYHLFGRIYLIHDRRFGANRLMDTQARMGETGQEIEALMRTGAYTHTNAYLSLAKDMLDGLEHSPLRDPVNGGFYFKIFLGPYMGEKAGFVDKTIKEARQLHVLIAVHLANQVFHQRWLGLEQDLIHVATQRLFLPAPVPGFTYRIQLNGQLYPCPSCVAPHVEDWVTSEADNIALEAMQTVLTHP
ncbi:hypothetical protein [Dictyobacter arantiisoli]|uniref:Uncharacterized protein n=1 Tax=Dictyobacter arantiisoli TaxID=2014874 RepID=A0A5A5TI40_9CHLR|nr:hypothetical protein [Dictyobacter arantiisoli]GCF10982.1 hypothetical protein KDI_45460 [Dictyobacter arantiisoli]